MSETPAGAAGGSGGGDEGPERSEDLLPTALERRRKAEDAAADSPEQFALNFDRRLAVAALWLASIALGVALLTVLLYATRETLLGSPWADLREASGWLFLIYLPAAFCSVLLGLFTIWISRDFKRSGALAAFIGGSSVLIILLGYAAAG